MIHYKMGISVNNIDDFSAYRENDTIVITHNVFGNKAIVSEDDVKAFYDSYSFDLNEFSNIISQFGIKVSSKENVEKIFGDEKGFAYDTLHKDPSEIDENANVSRYSNFITTNMTIQKNGFVIVK
jgi:RNA recognition motif-containing protein